MRLLSHARRVAISYVCQNSQFAIAGLLRLFGPFRSFFFATVGTNSHQNSHQTILASPIWRGQFNLSSLFCWCREGGSNPHDPKVGGF